MRQLPLAEHLDHYRSYFPGPHLDLVLASMIAGNTGGELWTFSQGDTPPSLLLWDQGNNVLYLAGDSQHSSSIESLADTIASHVQPHAVAAGATRFKTRALSPSLEEALPTLFPGIALRASTTRFFVHDSARHLPIVASTVVDLTFLPITRDTLVSGELAYSDYVLSEIRSKWPSEERFDEYGFGIVAVLEGEIIGWCTAEYVSARRCGIGIETAPRFEGRGVATATAARFIQEAQQRGITACWECDVTNRGSVRVAEKTGFVRESEEIYWIGSFGQ